MIDLTALCGNVKRSARANSILTNHFYEAVVSNFRCHLTKDLKLLQTAVRRLKCVSIAVRAEAQKTAKDLSISQQILIVPGWDLDPRGNSLRCVPVLALVPGEESLV